MGPFYCCPNPWVEYEGSDAYCTLERKQTRTEYGFDIVGALDPLTLDPSAITNCNDKNAYLFPMTGSKGKLMCEQTKELLGETTNTTVHTNVLDFFANTISAGLNAIAGIKF